MKMKWTCSDLGYMHLIEDNNQPERLNPEDHIADMRNMVCDSPNPDNKENQGITQK